MNQPTNAQLNERAREIQRRRERQREADLSQLMGEDWGRRIVRWLLMDELRLQSTSFDVGIKDGLCAALHSARLEGMREAGISLHVELLRLAPAQLLTMQAEEIRELQADLALEVTAASAGDTIE